MKNKMIFISMFAWFLIPWVSAQNPANNLQDQERIAITPIVPAELTEIPEPARPILENKLQNLANTHGFGGISYQPQFVLVARPIVVEKQLSATRPPLIKVDLETTYYIADYLTKTVFATTSLSSVGLGASDAEAYSSAFRNIQTNAPGLVQFMKTGRDEIISFYNDRCDFILGKADMFDSIGQYDAALSILLGVPEVCKDCFQKAVRKAGGIYQKALEQRCMELVQQARSVWSASPGRAGADNASALLALIPPTAKCAGDAGQLNDEIYTKMLELEKWDRKVYEDNRKMQMYYLESQRLIGVAQAENQPQFGLNIVFRGWLW